MRNYEITYIVQPDLDKDAFTALNDLVKGWIKDSKGKLDKSDVWGKRKMAYQIRKQSEGQYVHLKAHLDPTFCAQLERQFGLQEAVMRFLIVAADEDEEK
jgi:small subunit ribosomal protein S6